MGFVMSIDTGNKMMKTNHFIFHSGIKRKEQKILPGEEGIFFKGINYLERILLMRCGKDIIQHIMF